MTKVLVASDLHLSEKIWSSFPILDDSYFSWHQIVDLAIDNDCEAIILAGDLLDKQKNASASVYHLMTGLKKLSDAGITVYYNQGQHEYQTIPWMELHGKCIHLNGKQVYELGDYRLSGIDYSPSSDLMAFFSSKVARQADILAMHQVWEDFMGTLCSSQAKFFDLPANVKLLITGDLHKNLIERTDEGLTVLSPGSTHLRSISEPEDKFVFLMEVSGDIEIEKLPLRTRRRIVYELQADAPLHVVKEDIDKLLAEAETYAVSYLSGNLIKPLIRLIYPADSPESVAVAESIIKDRAHIFNKPKKKEVEDALSFENNNETSDRFDLHSCLNNYVDKAQSPNTHELASLLISSTSPEEAISSWVAKKVNE